MPATTPNWGTSAGSTALRWRGKAETAVATTTEEMNADVNFIVKRLASIKEGDD